MLSLKKYLKQQFINKHSLEETIKKLQFFIRNRTLSQRPMNRPYKGPTAGSIPSKARFSEDFIILHYSV